jgi:hypothetical protein
VHDGAAKAHLHTGLGGGVEGIVVAIETVEESGFGGGLGYGCGIRGLAGWWVVDWVFLAYFGKER